MYVCVVVVCEYTICVQRVGVWLCVHTRGQVPVFVNQDNTCIQACK